MRRLEAIAQSECRRAVHARAKFRHRDGQLDFDAECAGRWSRRCGLRFPHICCGSPQPRPAHQASLGRCAWWRLGRLSECAQKLELSGVVVDHRRQISSPGKRQSLDGLLSLDRAEFAALNAFEV